MQTPGRSIALFLIAAMIGALGQYLYREGARMPMADTMAWLTNWRILLGLVCYIAVMVLFLTGFRIGGEMTVLYPMYASTFIWALLIGRFLLGEPVGLTRIIGVGVIMIGMFLVAK